MSNGLDEGLLYQAMALDRLSLQSGMLTAVSPAPEMCRPYTTMAESVLVVGEAGGVVVVGAL